MEKLAQVIVDQMKIADPAISQSRLDIIKFGLECILGELSKLAAYFFIFWILGLREYFIVSTLVFCILRAVAGGYHEESYWRCFITSFVTFGAIIFLARTLPLDALPRLALMIPALIITFIYAPVDHPNKPIISHERRKRLKYISCAMLIIIGAISYLADTWIAAAMVYSAATVAAMLPLGRIANKLRLEKSEQESLI